MDAPDEDFRVDPITHAAHRWRLRHPESEAMAAALRLERAQDLVSARLNALLKPLDLNVVRYEVLSLLAFSPEGSLALGQMSDWMMVHPTSVTNNIDRLEAQGYVRRTPNPKDRRGVLTELTSSGREVVARATELLVEERFGLGELSRGEHVQLNRILANLTRAGGTR